MHMHVDHTRNQDTRSQTAVTPPYGRVWHHARDENGAHQQRPLLGWVVGPTPGQASAGVRRARKVSERNRLLAGRLSCRPPRLCPDESSQLCSGRAGPRGVWGFRLRFSLLFGRHDVRGSGARGWDVGSLHCAGRRRVRGRYIRLYPPTFPRPRVNMYL